VYVSGSDPREKNIDFSCSFLGYSLKFHPIKAIFSLHAPPISKSWIRPPLRIYTDITFIIIILLYYIYLDLQ
jgi:hypothetical protein